MSTYHHWYRLTRDPKLRGRHDPGRAHAGAPVPGAGEVSPLVRRPRVDLHRHHDECGNSLLRGPRDPGRGAQSRGHGALPQHAPPPGCAGTAPRPTRRSSTWRRAPALHQSTHQGFRGDSCWSRGLAWSLYGFGIAYRYSRDRRFLETAEQNADYYIDATPAHGVPPWDYDAPTESRRQPDSSAAAVAASGLLDLATFTSSRAKSRLYTDTALRILDTLTGDEFLARHTPGWEGILKHGVYHIHRGLGVDESVMWGEYFFVEALVKALEHFGA